MKRMFFFALLIALSMPTTWADIKTRKEGKTLLVDFLISKDSTALFQEDSIPQWSYFEKDIQDALNAVAQQKCNAMIVYDKDGQIYKIFKGKDQLTMKHIKDICDGMTYTKHIDGDVIGKKTVKRNVAKYRQDTYLNGKLQSRYESDWSSGWFAPTTSTYKNGGDTYETRTYYYPPTTETVEIRGPGEDVKIEGYTVFAEMVYRHE